MTFLRQIALLACFFGFVVDSEAQDSMTLNGAIMRALSHDPVIRKSESDTREATGYSIETKADLGPQVRLQGSSGYANRDRSIDGVSSGGEDLFSRQISLIGEQLLWDGGLSRYRWRDAEKREEGKAMLEKAQREITAFYTTEAFLDVIRARRQIHYARENLVIHKKVRNLAGERAEAAGNQADVELSAARYDLALTLLKERELALDLAESVFNRYVGTMPPPHLASPSVPRIGSIDEISPEGNFHYQAALLQKQAAVLAKSAIEQRYKPRVFFRGTGTLGEDVLGIRGEDNEASALVVVEWDLFESGRKRGELEQALADIDRQTSVIDETVVLLEQDIRSRWADYTTIQDRIGVLRRYERELGRTGDLYEEQFELGTRPLLSTLDIRNEEIGAAIRLADEEFEEALLGYRLLSFGGRLIRETVGEQYLLPEGYGDAKEPIAPESEIPRRAELVAEPTATPPDGEKKKFRPFGFLQRKDVE